MDLITLYQILGRELLEDNLALGSFHLDSRNIGPGDVFLAVKGEVLDGHDYIDQALDKGARLIIGSDDAYLHLSNYLCVEDVQSTLIELAKKWRLSYKGKIIAVTGTVAKTSVKELIVSNLQAMGEVSYSAGNFNNEWGVPLSVLNANLDSLYWVIEVGASHPGDIKSLIQWLMPDVGIITKVGIGHTLHLKDEQGVADCKYEMIDAMPSHALALIQDDDEKRFNWETRSPVIRIGKDVSADNISLSWMSSTADFKFSIRDIHGYDVHESWSIELKQNGLYAIENALIVASLMRYLNVPIKNIQNILLDFHPGSGRGKSFCINGCWVIDDSYNANPTSMKSAVDSLLCAPEPRAVYLGDMLDLGDDVESRHMELVSYVQQHGIKILCTKGELMKAASSEFSNEVYHDPTSIKILDIIGKHSLGSMLIKGSNAQKLGDLVKNLKDNLESK